MKPKDSNVEDKIIIPFEQRAKYLKALPDS
jgi:hypothetical protein